MNNDLINELLNAYEEIVTYQRENEGEVYYTKQKLLEDYKELVEISKHPVYRCIRLSNLDTLNYKHLGIYWTNYKHKAISYDSPISGEDYVIEAQITMNNIDIGDSIVFRRLFPEDEVRLIEGTNVKVLNIYKNNKPLNISGNFLI